MTDKKAHKPLLSAKAILDVDDMTFEEVEVPEWGGSIRLRSLTAEEASKFSDEYSKDRKNAAVRILLMACVDDKGEPLFKPEDLDVLRKKSLKAVIKVQKVAMKMNGLKDDDEAKND